jgi:hypothetical protein
MKKTVNLFISIIALTSLLIFSLAFAKGNSSQSEDSPTNTPTVYINKFNQSHGKTYLTVDTILWYEGEAANKKMREHEKNAELTEAPDGYYIINDSKKLLNYEVAPDAAVLMQIYHEPGSDQAADVIPDKKITLEQFMALMKQNDTLNIKDYPYHLMVQNGTIVKIVQQYIP